MLMFLEFGSPLANWFGSCEVINFGSFQVPIVVVFTLRYIVVCSDVSEALLRVLRTLSVSCLLCLLRCFRGSLAGFTHFIRLSPVQSLLRCFRGSFLHCTVLHYIARLRFTFRWEGMAASTNCSSNVNCCATLRTYLVHREQRSTMTEERNSKTACSS